MPLTREEWLKEQGRTEGDVMEDTEGEYVYDIYTEELGAPGWDYQVREIKQKIYIPAAHNLLKMQPKPEEPLLPIDDIPY